MNKHILKDIIVEQNKFVKTINTGIERNDLAQIKKYFKLPHNIVIAGIRRAGKSTLLRQIMNHFVDKWHYFNFEDERLVNFQVTDFNNLFEILVELYGDKKIFFFDEIQNIDGWERFVRRMSDNNYKFFITGSNASLLSRELGTKLTGRYFSFDLYPFSFKEYLSFNRYNFKISDLSFTKKRAVLKRYFKNYLSKGGMPEYLQYKTLESLRRVYNDILYRDIIVRYDIREDKVFRELSLYLTSNIANLFSYNSLKNFLGLGSVNTVKSYIDYLEASFLFFSINVYANSLKQQIMAPKKIYCIDNGLANAIGFRFSDNKGDFLENLVFIELKRRNKEIYYYKTSNNLEVDFLIKDGQKKELIQVAYDILNEKTRKREIKSLLAAMNELKIIKGIILTYDNEETLKIENKEIKIIPVYKWLLN